MTYTRRLFGEGGWQSGERWMVTMSTSYQPGGTAVIHVPGVSADGWFYADKPEERTDLEILARAGCLVMTATFADVDGGDGGSSWGNQAGRDHIDSALTFVASEYGADTDRILMIGSSEGGDLALNWAWRHPDRLAGLSTHLTPPNVQALYDANGLVASLIELAFDTAGGWAANRATHDPAANYSLITPIADRTRMYYSTDDGLAPAVDHLAIAAATGVRVVPIGAVMHTATAVPFHHEAAWLLDRLTT